MADFLTRLLPATARRTLTAILAGSLALTVSACSQAPDPTDIVGLWQADNGDLIEVGANGACNGLIYNHGEQLDIGGPMTCQIGSNPDSDGRYLLLVVQKPNEKQLLVEFVDDDHVQLYTSSGRDYLSLTRR